MFTERSPWNTKISMKSQAYLKKIPRYNQFTWNSQDKSGIALLTSSWRLF